MTMEVRPAAGPLTLSVEPLKMVTKIPPINPAKIPEKSGTLQAKAMPKHSGKATKKTTMPERKFFERSVIK
jgi:hypothetical protein